MTDLSRPDLRELLRLLGNESRMQIMRALWDDFDFPAYVIESQSGIRFSTLRERAGIDDPGNFNYHLNQLQGTLITATDESYILTPLGYNVMKAFDHFASFEYTTFDDWTAEDPCPLCSGELVAAYRREMVEVRCRDCGGLGDGGNFTYIEVSGSGVKSLDQDELLDAATLTMFAKLRSSMEKICWRCRDHMQVDFDRCEDHQRGDTGICQTCSHRYQTTVNVGCDTCGISGRGPILEYAIVDPRTATLFSTVGSGPQETGPWTYRLRALGSATEIYRSRSDNHPVIEFEIENQSLAVEIFDSGDRIRSRPTT